MGHQRLLVTYTYSRMTIYYYHNALRDVEYGEFDTRVDKFLVTIPKIRNIVVGNDQPYEYLVKSIKNFYNQKELIDLMKKNNFYKCEYRNLSGGIVAIHSGWKI